MKLNEKLFTSIQARLLWIFLTITMITVVIVIAFNQWIRVQLVAAADSALLVSATLTANQIDEFNRSNQQAFHIGSRLPILIDYILADEDQRNDSEFRKQTLDTLASLQFEPWDEYYVLSQGLLDGDGLNILDTSNENIGIDESQQVYFRTTVLGGSVNTSALQYNQERSGIYFYYAVPIRENTEPFSIVGVLRIQVSIASIQDLVFDNTRGQDLHVALFAENYVRVVDNQHEELLFRSITNFSQEELITLHENQALPPLSDSQISIPLPNLVEALVNTQKSQIITGQTHLDSDGEERIAIIQLETVPWYLTVSQPSAQYYLPIQRQTTGIFFLAILLTLIALISSIFVSRRITEPIRILTAVAERVAEGDLDTKAPITSNDEVGTLTKTFNEMTSELQQFRYTLEERVEKQTNKAIADRKLLEQKNLEFALEHERIRILSEFIRKASHEFKTPLSIINLNSHLVKRLLPMDRQNYISLITEQSKYIEGLVNMMVLMSRIDSGITIPTKLIHIDEFMKAIYISEKSSFERKNAIVDFNLQSEDAWVYANPELLFTSIQNILHNAIKYSQDSLEINVKTRRIHDTIIISIQDNGIGIPQALQSRIFERFFRVDEAHSTRGFGLGLPIAKRIIESSGGTIELESELEIGTTVTIKLCHYAADAK